VLGKSFVSDPEADIWLPFQIDPSSTNQGHYFQAAGRLKSGMTLAQANAQLKLAYDEFRRRYPDANPKDSFAVEPLRDTIVSEVRSSLFVLLGAVSLVLLIACANVANLLLVRASVASVNSPFGFHGSHPGPHHPSIIDRKHPARPHRRHPRPHPWLPWRARPTRAQSGNIPRIGENGAAVSIDWRVLAFTLGVSLLTGIVFGLVPPSAPRVPTLIPR